MKNPICTEYHIIHENKTLDKPDSINDLGVIFDSNLSFRDHISHKTNKDYSILGIIKRNFIYMDEITFIQLYTSMVAHTCVAWWLSGRALDLRFTCRGFNSRPVAFT